MTSDVVSDKRQLCELACRKPNNDTCMSTRDLVEQNLIRDLEEGLSLRPGSPCDNFQGYCDVFLKCRKVDAEGPLVRLKNLIFNQENLISIAQWVTVSIMENASKCCHYTNNLISVPGWSSAKNASELGVVSGPGRGSIWGGGSLCLVKVSPLKSVGS